MKKGHFSKIIPSHVVAQIAIDVNVRISICSIIV